MSAWITPSGTIGTYTQGQPLTFTFAATATQGGKIRFQIANNTSFPPGSFTLTTSNPSPGVYHGTLSGTPAYVNGNTQTSFVINATEFGYGFSTDNNRTFSMTVSVTEWNTPAGSIGSFSEDTALSFQFSATPSNPANFLSYTLLNGSLPTGNLTLNPNGLLSGTPSQVSTDVTSTFTIRVTETNGVTVVGFRDRTFSATVSGTTAPQFITPSGLLFTTLDSTWISFPLQYTDPDPVSVGIITLVAGELPPGLEINSSGLIRGYANPPTDSLDSPINKSYTFTVQLTSTSGEARAQYTITVNNQELVGGFTGRNPVVYNYQPPTFNIPPSAPYAAYYLTSSDIGQIMHNNDFIFKFIGHDFDGDSLMYDIDGIPTNSTGWMELTFPDIGDSIQVFEFTVSVYKASDPSKRSDAYPFSLTIVGNINPSIAWVTPSDLGQIINGSVSVKSVKAEAAEENLELAYRLASSVITTDLNAVVRAPTNFYAYGLNGDTAHGSSDGQTWAMSTHLADFDFTSAVYDSITGLTVAVGYDTGNNPRIELTNDGIDYSPGATLATQPLRNVNVFGSIFIAVGDTGTIVTSIDDAITWIQKTSGVTENLYSVAHSGFTYVIVGESTTILRSIDSNTWTPVSVPVEYTATLRSVVWTGSAFVAVGDSGLVARSTNGTAWSFAYSLDTEYRSVAYRLGVLIAVGVAGAISYSVDDGITWIRQVNSVNENNLNSIIYDTVTNKWCAVGDAGTVILSTTGADWSSPTIGKLPPNLILQSSGDITGRLAFESTSTTQLQNQTNTYTFTVEAYSVLFPQIKTSRTFTLTTYQQFTSPYDNLYIKALMSHEDRGLLNGLLENTTIFPPAYIYRPNDPYFGLSSKVIYQHLFGVPSSTVPAFIESVNLNHYWRNVTLGELATAVAKDETGNVIYEVVYSKIIDNLVRDVDGNVISISKEILWPRDIPLNLNDYYDSNVNIYDSYTYYDLTPSVRTVLSVTGAVLELNSVEGIELYMNVTGDGIINAVDGTPPIVTAIDPTTNTVTLSVSQEVLAPMLLSSSSDVTYTWTWSPVDGTTLGTLTGNITIDTSIASTSLPQPNPATGITAIPAWVSSLNLVSANIPYETGSWSLVDYTGSGKGWQWDNAGVTFDFGQQLVGQDGWATQIGPSWKGSLELCSEPFGSPSTGAPQATDTLVLTLESYNNEYRLTKFDPSNYQSFYLEWAPQGGATGKITGMITFDINVANANLPQGDSSSVGNEVAPIPAWVTDLTITVSGATAGNGTWTLSDFTGTGLGWLWYNAGIVYDFSQPLIGQGPGNGWGNSTDFSPLGDFGLFSSGWGVGPVSAPTSLSEFTLEAANGGGTYRLTTFSPANLQTFDLEWTPTVGSVGSMAGNITFDTNVANANLPQTGPIPAWVTDLNITLSGAPYGNDTWTLADFSFWYWDNAGITFDFNQPLIGQGPGNGWGNDTDVSPLGDFSFGEYVFPPPRYQTYSSNAFVQMAPIGGGSYRLNSMLPGSTPPPPPVTSTLRQVLFNDPAYTSMTYGVARRLYPNSLPNMRQQVTDVLGNVNNVSVLPLWMSSQQANGSTLGYTPAWVICYTKPGYSELVKTNIETLWPYTLNQLNFGVDRFEVDRSMTYNYDPTIGVWDALPSAQPTVTGDSTDAYIYFPQKTILPNTTQE